MSINAPEPSLQDIAARLDILTNAMLCQKTVLTMEEAALFTGLSTSHLYKMTSAQEIPHYKPHGKKLYFKRDELENWLLQARVKTMDEMAAEVDKRVA